MRLHTGWIGVFLLLVTGVLGYAPPHAAYAQPADTPPGAFVVTDRVPFPGDDGVNADAPLLVVFNRPVVPLTFSPADASVLPAPLTLDPPAPGLGTWISPAIYQYSPDALAAGVTYTATVDPTLTALDGTPLTAPDAWTFSTVPPAILAFTPADETPARLDAPITFTFNQRVDRASAEASVTVTASTAGGDPTPVSGDFTWDEAGTMLTFTPVERYPIASLIAVSAGAGVTGVGGGTPIASPVEWMFETVPQPAVVGTSPMDGERDASIWNGIAFYFASPMNPATIADRIVIDPAPPQINDGYYSEWDTSYYVAFTADPSTEYTITLQAGAEDIYGNAITEPYTFSYMTEMATPELALRSPYLGYYSAAGETTVFLTQRNLGGAFVSLFEVETDTLARTLADEELGFGYTEARLGLVQGMELLGEAYYPPDAPVNVRRYDAVALGELVGAQASTENGRTGGQPAGTMLPPGAYSVRIQTETGDLSDIYAVLVATTVLTMKNSADEALVWATDIASGLPVPAARLMLYHAGRPLITATTDADGIARFTDLPPSELYNYGSRMVVLDEADRFGVGWGQWTDGIDPWSFGVTFDDTPPAYTIYTYSDRPVYRPDQPVYFRGIVREYADLAYPVPPDTSVTVTLYDPEGTTVYQADLPLTGFGGFSDTAVLPRNSALGQYRIEVTPPGEEVGQYFESNSYYFQVQEYRAPEFAVTLTPERDAVADGDTIRVLVDARYFFGGTVAGGAVEYTVINQPYYFEPDGLPATWSWQDTDPDAGASEFYYFGGGELASGTGVLDAAGQFMIELPADLEDATQSQVFSIEATVLDESGMAVVGRVAITVHQGGYYIGVRPVDYVAQAGDEAAVDLVAVDWQGMPQPGREIAITVVERRWSSVQEMDEAGYTTWTYNVEEIPVTEGVVTTDETGRAVFTFTPPTGGVFKIIARALDDADRPLRSAAGVWAAGPEYIAWRQQNSNRIDLIVGATQYRVGETAEVLITSPFQGETRALVTVERGDVITSEVITLVGNSYLYRLPITADLLPTAYVSVMIVAGADETTPYPQFRMGLAQIAIDNSDRALNIELTPATTDAAAPGSQQTWTIRTTDAAGNPVSAEVSLALTDQAVLSIAERTEQDIMDAFYGVAPLSVITSSPLVASVDQITQEVLDTVKGGGGGFGEGGIFDIREDFIDTPYWEAALVTDADGLASFTFTLPDNLTTWVLDARAITLGDEAAGDPVLVGQTTTDFVSTLPILIRPVTPRFFVAGDAVTLAALVNNNTAADVTALVTVQAGGLLLADGVTAGQTVTVPAGGRVRVEWPVTVPDDVTVTEADLLFFAEADDGAYADASRPPLANADGLLPIVRYDAPETVGTSGVLMEAGRIEEQVMLPTVPPVTSATVTVRLDAALGGVIVDGLETLDRPLYESNETLASRLLANAYAVRIVQFNGVLTGDASPELNVRVTDAITRLTALQNIDGGWGWVAGAPSDPLTSAYALLALAESRETGYTVPEDTVQPAIAYVQRQQMAAGADTTEALNRRAFMLYALATADRPVSSLAAILFEQRERLSVYGRALLLKAYVREADDGAIPPQAVTLAGDLIAAATITATGVSWDDPAEPANWNTDTRTTALALSALLDVNDGAPVDSALLPGAVRWLAAARTADAWPTAHETAWALMALSEWLIASGEPPPAYSYRAAVNDAALFEDTFNPGSPIQPLTATVPLPTDMPTSIVIERGEGAGVLYYTAHVTAALPVPALEPLDAGLLLSRQYTRPGDAAAVVTAAQVGETITGRLTIIVPTALHNVVITDPIPAGTDAVNPALAIVPQITEDEAGLYRADVQDAGWNLGWFSRIEYRDQAVVLYAPYLPAGSYLFVYTLRAGLPGVYNVIPPTGQAVYFPEIYGRGAGSVFTITPAG